MNAATAPLSPLNAQYGMNPPHSEVVEACALVPRGYTLDMGCSSGRNALYLQQQGHQVTAVDVNPGAIDTLQTIIDGESLADINARVYDINQADLKTDYDFIACTVTLMFLEPERVAAVLADMQAHTRVGGYNLIVAAMDTEAYPCRVNFPFKLKEGQLSAFYDGWELVKYNEDVGTMHNGMQMQFATLLARKTD